MYSPLGVCMFAHLYKLQTSTLPSLTLSGLEFCNHYFNALAVEKQQIYKLIARHRVPRYELVDLLFLKNHVFCRIQSQGSHSDLRPDSTNVFWMLCLRDFSKTAGLQACSAAPSAALRACRSAVFEKIVKTVSCSEDICRTLESGLRSAFTVHTVKL